MDFLKSLKEDIVEDIKNSKKENQYDLARLSEDDIFRLYGENDEIVTRNVKKNARSR